MPEPPSSAGECDVTGLDIKGQGSSLDEQVIVSGVEVLERQNVPGR